MMVTAADDYDDPAHNDSAQVPLKSVILDANAQTLNKSTSHKRPSSSTGTDEESRKRGRRMMGVLLGTLNQFRQETAADQPALQRQKQIQERLAEKMQEERALLAAAVAREQEERRATLEQAKLQWELEQAAELEANKSERRRIFATYLQTKGELPLFYLPAILTDQQQAVVDKQLAELDKCSDSETSP